jgi:hypothetical protein
MAAPFLTIRIKNALPKMRKKIESEIRISCVTEHKFL